MNVAMEGGAAPALAKPALLLCSREDLAAYVAGRRWLGRQGEIVLRLPVWTYREQRATEARLNFWRKVCGCLPGGLTVLAAMVWWAIALAQAESRTAGMLAAAAAYVLVLGIAVKIAAIALARAALVLEIGRLWWRFRDGGEPLGE